MNVESTWALEDFIPCLGQEFSIDVLRIRLVEATRLHPTSQARATSAFQLQFHCPDHSVACFLRQRIYTVTHERLGQMEIFLVPIGPPRDGSGGFLYQAVFH